MKTFLFSVDVEGASPSDSSEHKKRVEAMTERYLDFLRRHNAKATFFVVGRTAEAIPTLVRRILAEGHEIGCHSHTHVPLDHHTPESFRIDLHTNVAALRAAGAIDIRGYRAPILSMTEKTQWAYTILKELGFTYSSSVLPAANPLYGWPGHPQEPTQHGILEIPVTLNPKSFPKWPIASGMYLRLLPRPYILNALRNSAGPLVTYTHPYDLDTREKYRPRPHRTVLFTLATYYNRRSVIPKYEAIMRAGFTIQTYADFVDHG